MYVSEEMECGERTTVMCALMLGTYYDLKKVTIGVAEDSADKTVSGDGSRRT